MVQIVYQGGCASSHSHQQLRRILISSYMFTNSLLYCQLQILVALKGMCVCVFKIGWAFLFIHLLGWVSITLCVNNLFVYFTLWNSYSNVLFVFLLRSSPGGVEILYRFWSQKHTHSHTHKHTCIFETGFFMVLLSLLNIETFLCYCAPVHLSFPPSQFMFCASSLRFSWVLPPFTSP